MTIKQAIKKLKDECKQKLTFYEFEKDINFLSKHVKDVVYKDDIFTFTLKTGYKLLVDCSANYNFYHSLEAVRTIRPYINNKYLQAIICQIYHENYKGNILNCFGINHIDVFEFINDLETDLLQQLFKTLKWLNSNSEFVRIKYNHNEYFVQITQDVKIYFTLCFSNKERLREDLLYVETLKPCIDKLFFMEKIK